MFQVGFFITIITNKIIDYGDGYVYPAYAVNVGLLMSFIPILPVPAYMIYAIYKAEGTLLQVTMFIIRRITYLPLLAK